MYYFTSMNLLKFQNQGLTIKTTKTNYLNKRENIIRAEPNKETADAVVGETVSARAESADAISVDAESVNAESVDAESVDAESVDSESVDAE